METCCEKDGCYGRWACVINVGGQYHYGDISTKWVDLAYDMTIAKASSFMLQASRRT